MNLFKNMAGAIGRFFDCDKISVHPNSISRTGNYRR